MADHPRTDRRKRKAIRLSGYDYTQAGIYFITTCTHDRQPLLGTITDGVMQLNRWGRIADAVWRSLPDRFAGLELNQYIVMPNHVHGLLVLDGTGGISVGEIARTFKAASARMIRLAGCKRFRWQHDFHDRIIRNDRELRAVQVYIVNNPQAWQLDKDNPESAFARGFRGAKPAESGR